MKPLSLSNRGDRLIFNAFTSLRNRSKTIDIVKIIFD